MYSTQVHSILMKIAFLDLSLVISTKYLVGTFCRRFFVDKLLSLTVHCKSITFISYSNSFQLSIFSR